MKNSQTFSKLPDAKQWKSILRARKECKDKIKALEYIMPMNFVTSDERQIMMTEINNLKNILKNVLDE